MCTCQEKYGAYYYPKRTTSSIRRRSAFVMSCFKELNVERSGLHQSLARVRSGEHHSLLCRQPVPVPFSGEPPHRARPARRLNGEVLVVGRVLQRTVRVLRRELERVGLPVAVRDVLRAAVRLEVRGLSKTARVFSESRTLPASGALRSGAGPIPREQSSTRATCPRSALC